MTKFIKLTKADGEEIHVNFALVTRFSSVRDGGTRLTFVAGSGEIDVKEDAALVANKLTSSID
ncbi:MAG: hypothetical protein WBX25_06205 [Rhodomicrobium sp.]